MRKDPMQSSTTYTEIAGPSIAVTALALNENQFELQQESVSQLAYRLWEERGRPEGSPEYDWFLAEELLRSGLPITASAA
jgi:Protein of unknown function (DUF2934)